MPILHLAIAQNHLAICKLILEQIQDIQLLNEWVKLMLHFATLFGHIDMVKFFIDEIQGIDPLTQLNGRGENIIEMAERMGHKDICTLFESFMQKQK
jgi:ankyrin repeat protein